ncbi:hypothetical protein QCE73_00050 [Caballeronia sp. LZ029]|uniref:hypothetical protein n=1 Tax=Caballeronia sp. LZ029 TaxID=3038564 RepID=UPI002854A777|nr:hypothetical protein [Caballeronia sp. LZ029]MDR5741539.1 hypothetical protein [Caballeronia sp. LZ029]
MTHYAARRYVCNQLPDETQTIRENVALSLYATARVRSDNRSTKARIEAMDSPLAGSW